MNLRYIKLIVWHKFHKSNYQVLKIDWNTGSISLITCSSSLPHAPEKLPYESIDSVVLSEIRFIS